MTMKTFPLCIFAFASVFHAAFSALPLTAADRKPNVILILADDLGYEDLNCYGHETIRTPALDQLADSGIRLTRFHSGATVCTPSRMALLTGSYPVRYGWEKGVVGFKMGLHEGMSGEAVTIAEIFKSAGYTTGIVGKWHIGDQPDTRPDAQGFDSSYWMTVSNNATDELWRGGKMVEKPFTNCLLTERFTEESKRFIRENQERPFFLYIPYTAPHFPVEPHPDWIGRSNFWKYGDVVEELDSGIGEIIKCVRDLGLEKETVVVFLSDNGPEPKELANCRPYRGEKWSALEGGTRVPCIVSWPGVIPAGQTSDALTSAIDLLPTLCRAAGIDWKERDPDLPPLDGFDVWDTFTGDSTRHPRNELLHWHGLSKDPQAITIGNWKLFFDLRHTLEGIGTKRLTIEQAEKVAELRQRAKSSDTPLPFLVNLNHDPGETIDLSTQYPERVRKMEARANELMTGIWNDTIIPTSNKPKA
jgi:arylsulfatase